MKKIQRSVVAATVAFIGGCTVHGTVGYVSTGADTEQGMPTGGNDASGTAADSSSGSVLLDLPDPADLPSYGEWWCVFASNATYTPDPNPGMDEPVVDGDGNPPEGCQCVPFNTDIHGWILANEVNEEIVIEQAALEMQLGVGDPLVDELLELRDDIYSDARTACASLVPNPNLGDSCNDPALFDVDASTPQFDPTPLLRGQLDGELDCIPVPEGVAPACEYADDIEQIRKVGSIREVKQYIFDGFLRDPTCLMISGWGIAVASAGRFELIGVQDGDMLDTLGFANGDEFVAISAGEDRYLLDTVEGALEAFYVLQHETSFEIDLIRIGSNMTLKYSIVP